MLSTRCGPAEPDFLWF